MTENKKNENNKSSRFNGSKSTTFLLLILVCILVFVVVEISLLIGKRGNQRPLPTDVLTVTDTPDPEESPSASAIVPIDTPAGQTPTEVPEVTPVPATETPTERISTPTPTVTAVPTPTPTAAPTPTQVPVTPGPTEGGIDDIAARIVDPSTIDFSFLDGLSREHFDDANENSFDWYPGSVVRDADGKVTYRWDRYASTINLIEKYGGIYRKNQDQNVCYLTFDCGYENGVTLKILDVLKEKNVKAIFFVTGDYAANETAIMKRMLAEGHLIGSHTTNHKIMPTVSDETFVSEMNGVYKTLKKNLGEDFKMVYYRPPQGASCQRDLALAEYLGYRSTFWSFAYMDYNVDAQPDPAASLERLKTALHPGCVFLLHAMSETNASILGDFIDFARGEGFEIRRIDQ